MSLLYRPKLRYRRPDVQRANARPDFKDRRRSSKDQVCKISLNTDIRFVRVADRLFKVPHAFFHQMPPETQRAIKFDAGHGSTPEKPIFLHNHSEDQFKQILTAFNAYPAPLDVDSFTLDHLLTIGELSTLYGMKNLVQWFIPAFQTLVLSPHTPLRTASNFIFHRVMALAIRLNRPDLLGVVQSVWARRLHAGGLTPLIPLRFADSNGLLGLLGHACYVYLLLVHKHIHLPHPFLSPRQQLYINAGYLSLRTYWDKIGRHPPDFVQGPGCQVHEHCVRVWRSRWAAVLQTPRFLQFPLVDVLNRLGYLMEALGRDDSLSVLSDNCRSSALTALAKRREQVSRHLHHHFDI